MVSWILIFLVSYSPEFINMIMYENYDGKRNQEALILLNLHYPLSDQDSATNPIIDL